MKSACLILLLTVIIANSIWATKTDSLALTIGVGSQLCMGDFEVADGLGEVGRSLEVQLGVQKSWYGATLSYSHFYRVYAFPYLNIENAFPNSFNASIVTAILTATPIQSKRVDVVMGLGLAYSFNSNLRFVWGGPTERADGSLDFVGQYLLEKSSTPGYTYKLNLIFHATNNTSIYGGLKVIDMQEPGPVEFLLGGGVRFLIYNW